MLIYKTSGDFMLSRIVIENKLKILECAKLFLNGDSIKKISELTGIEEIEVEKCLNDRYIADIYGINKAIEIKKQLINK